jgi:hypothetical protein
MPKMGVEQSVAVIPVETRSFDVPLGWKLHDIKLLPVESTVSPIVYAVLTADRTRNVRAARLPNALRR